MIKDLVLNTITVNDAFLLPFYTSLPPSATRRGALAYQSSNSTIYVWQGNSWQPVTIAGSINVVTVSPILGGQVVTFGDTLTLSHAGSGAGGSYGNASTGNIPSITVDSTGHVSLASQAVLSTRTVQGDGASINGSGSVYGSGSPIVFSLINTGVANATYGSNIFIPQFTVGLDGRISSASNIVPATITINTSRPLTITGPLSLGGAVTMTNTALLDADANSNWRAGTGSSFGAGTTSSVVVGNSASTNAGATSSVAIGVASNTGNRSVTIGGNASPVINTDRNVFIGYQAGLTSSGGTGSNVFIGYQAGNGLTSASDTICIGDSSATFAGTLATSLRAVTIGSGTEINTDTVTIGYQARTTIAGNIAIGSGALAAAPTGCTAIGTGVQNFILKSTLIGASGVTATTHTVTSTGYFKSYQACGAKAGINTPNTQVINTGSPLTTLDLQDTFYDTGNPLSYVDLALNRVYVGSFGLVPDDTNQIFSIQVAIVGQANIASTNAYAELDYTDEFGAPAVTIAMDWISNETGPVVAFNMSTTVKIGASMTSRPYVQVRIGNNGASDITITYAGISVTRIV